MRPDIIKKKMLGKRDVWKRKCLEDMEEQPAAKKAKSEPIGIPRAMNVYSLSGKCVEIMNRESIWKRAVVLKAEDCIKDGRNSVEHEVLFDDAEEPIELCLEHDWNADAVRVVQLKVRNVFQKNVQTRIFLSPFI